MSRSPRYLNHAQSAFPPGESRGHFDVPGMGRDGRYHGPLPSLIFLAQIDAVRRLREAEIEGRLQLQAP